MDLKLVSPKCYKKTRGGIISISIESAVFIPEGMIHYGMTRTAQLAISRGPAELTKGSDVTEWRSYPCRWRINKVSFIRVEILQSGLHFGRSFITLVRPLGIFNG